MGFHGPMLDRGDDVDSEAIAVLAAQLRGEARLPLVLRGTGMGGGNARGRLVGGSLTLIAASIGTPWEIDTRGAILMLEDVGERPFRIDRCLAHLRAAGKLAPLAGVAVGGLVECSDPRYPEADAREVVLEALRPLGVPVVTDLPFGHVDDNRPWPVGARAELDGERGELTILERGVTRR
jgi:muramoyltetrapeptide carboxypeptidase